MITKSEKWTSLRQAIVDFERSDRLITDYMALFIVLFRVMKPGSGLIWRDVEEAVDSALREIG